MRLRLMGSFSVSNRRRRLLYVSHNRRKNMKKDLFKNLPPIRDPKDKLFDYRDKSKPLTGEDLEVEEANKNLESQIDDD
jgi:hypothetical protein